MFVGSDLHAHLIPLLWLDWRSEVRIANCTGFSFGSPFYNNFQRLGSVARVEQIPVSENY